MKTSSKKLTPTCVNIHTPFATSSITMKYWRERERESSRYGLLNFKCFFTNHATFRCKATIELYESHVLPHLEYCSQLGINKTVIKKYLTKLDHYVFKTLLNTGNASNYNSILSLASMESLGYRCE